uniref:galectin-7-like n=1 Tax=Podarcis muralis TaxID=64176 RepID=UPI00109FDCD3|nr:galectin-7-like [Podarcis muralis]
MAIVPDNFNIPFYRAIPQGLEPESWVLLEGIIPQQGKRFYVDFSSRQVEEGNKPLRLTVSFEGPPSSPGWVTLNSFADQQWGEGLTVVAPFRRGQEFRIQIIVTRMGYKILEKDISLCEFRHRLSPKSIRFLEVDGEVKLQNVAVSWEGNRAPRGRILPTLGMGRYAR